MRTKEQGLKLDKGKVRYALTVPEVDREVAAVLTFGAVKYDDGNWRHVHDPQDRYYDAARRHMEAWRMGESLDSETQLHHLAQAICCLHFLLGIELEGTSLVRESFAERFRFALDEAHKLRAEREKREANGRDERTDCPGC